MQETIDELFEKYNYEIKYPLGWNKSILDPKHAHYDYINEIIDYLINPYPLTKLKSPNWDQDLLAVAHNLKPCALIDNDSYLDPTIDTFLRHNLELLGIVGKIVITDDDDTGVIYYNKNGRDKAMLLAMYYKNLIDLTDLNIDQDIFQSILLGYSKESLALHLNDSTFDFECNTFLQKFPKNKNEIKEIEEKLRKENDEENGELFFGDEDLKLTANLHYWNAEKKLSVLKIKDKMELYKKFYNLCSKNLDEIYSKYEETKSKIDLVLKSSMFKENKINLLY